MASIEVDDQKPLHVRCAEALGWWGLDRFPGGIMLPDPHDLLRWFGRPPGVVIIGSELLRVPPFGEDTSEGWACTGPLLTRFQPLQLAGDQYGWECHDWTIMDDCRFILADTACAAIAEWVAKYVENGQVKNG